MNPVLSFSRRLGLDRPLWGGIVFDEQRARQVLHVLVAALAVVVMLSTGFAFAFQTPAAGSFAYDIYDVVINQILNGPIGYVGGAFLLVWGGLQALKAWPIAITSIIIGTVIIKANSLLTTLGVLIN